MELSACSQRPRQILVADKIGSLCQECRIAKDMIRVTVRVDDVSDWLFGAGANGREQLSSFAHAAAGIDHRNRFVADDETGIGSRALILTCHQRGQAMMHERSGCDFADRRRALPRLRERESAEQCEPGKNRSTMNHNSGSVASQTVPRLLRA